MKKAFSFLSILALVLSQSAVPVSAAEIVQQQECDTTTNAILMDDGVLTISGTGSMDEQRHLCLWENIGFWQDDTYRNQVESIVVEDGVTEVMHLCDMENLKEITLPDTLTSIVGAFVDCPNLTSVTIPASVVEIGIAFHNLSSDFVAFVYAGK